MKKSISALASILFAFLALSRIGQADQIETNDATIIGTVRSIDTTSISYTACRRSKPAKHLVWSNVRLVRFSKVCKELAFEAQRVGAVPCTARVDVFEISLVGSQNNVVFATQFTLDTKGNIRAVLPKGNAVLMGNRSGIEIATIEPSRLCLEEIPAKQSWSATTQ